MIYNNNNYYCNKLTEDMFCLTEQRNNCLSKKVVIISIYIFYGRKTSELTLPSTTINVF